jgi:hypothetical protein
VPFAAQEAHTSPKSHHELNIWQRISLLKASPRAYNFGVSWLKLADTKDSFPHPSQTIFSVGCVRTVDIKNRSLISVDISWHYK